MFYRVFVGLLLTRQCYSFPDYHWCDFISDGVDFLKFDCVFNFTEAIQVSVNNEISMLSNLFEFKQKSMDALCFQPESCSLTYALILNSILLNELSNFKLPQVDNVVAMNLFLRQQIMNNIIINNFDLDDSSYLDFTWTVVPTFGFAASISLDSEMQTTENSNELISMLKTNTVDIVKWAKVNLAIGFIIGSEVTSTDIAGNWLSGASLCLNVINALPSVNVTCHGYVPLRMMELNDALKSPVRLHKVDPSATMDWDLREQLCRDLLAIESIDYFILLDEKGRFGKSSQVLSMLAGFINHHTLMSDFGVGYLNSNDARRRLVPSLLVLSRKFFDVFTESVFDVAFPARLNNMLLLDVFSILQATFPFNWKAAFSTIGGDMDDLMATVSNATLELYVTKVYILRKTLLSQVNAVYYPDAPIKWSVRDLAYKDGDLLYQHYCKRSPGCVNDVMVTTGNLDNTHGRTAHSAFTARTSELPLHKTPINSPARIAYITAVFGNYEAALKSFARQNVYSDFICFTDDPDKVVNSNGGWIVDSNPYHLDALKYDLEHNKFNETNSLHNNQHPFNIAKYYKMNFHRIDRLLQYDVVVWMDGSVEVHNANTSRLILDLINNHNQSIVLFERGKTNQLSFEVNCSKDHPKYSDPYFIQHQQPYQNVSNQYYEYTTQLGYQDSSEYWKVVSPLRRNYGLWITCFVAFDLRRRQVRAFLSMWNDHNRRYTTQDQVSFPFVVQKLGVFPYSFPPLPSEGYIADIVKGEVRTNTLFHKHDHGW